MEITQVGRQPILDRAQKTFGYELLYQYENCESDIGDSENPISARTLLHTFLDFSLKHLIGSHRAFVKFNRAFFTHLHPPLLDKSRFVLEVLDNIPLDDEFVDSICKLHGEGYYVALSDYKFEPQKDILLPYCSILKIDFNNLVLDEKVTKKLTDLKHKGVLLLAEKVETYTEFETALGMGFDLFQGYFFAKPQVMGGRILQNHQSLLLKMISRINDPTIDLEELARLISLDAKLSMKVIRFVNSAFFGFPKKIDAIRQAVMYVGIKKVRAWASLFIMADMPSKSPEIIRMALVRAEFCYLVSQELAVDDPDSAYMIGLLSILDAVLDQPIDQLLKDLPLPIEMVDALIENVGPYSVGLRCVHHLERGDPLASLSGSMPVGRLIAAYMQAIRNAEEILYELV